MEMAVLLRDKICIVTGAASLRGIGYATAELFAEHGARVGEPVLRAHFVISCAAKSWRFTASAKPKPPCSAMVLEY
jgi:enoyl-[acyl-carrier-protein] reductase (NADH)